MLLLMVIARQSVKFLYYYPVMLFFIFKWMKHDDSKQIFLRGAGLRKSHKRRATTKLCLPLVKGHVTWRCPLGSCSSRRKCCLRRAVAAHCLRNRSTVSSDFLHLRHSASECGICWWFRGVYWVNSGLYHVEDGSVAHLALDVVAVKLVDHRKLIGSFGWAARQSAIVLLWMVLDLMAGRDENLRDYQSAL